MLGYGADGCYQPHTEEEAARGWEVDSRGRYCGGRISKPYRFMRAFGVTTEELCQYMIEESFVVKKENKKFEGPEATDWWCLNCGYPINFKKNEGVLPL